MKKKLSETDVINKWLGDYHNTSIEQLLIEHPEWETDPHEHTKTFYDMHRVTQEQHDEWKEWLVKALMKEFRMSRKYTERGLWAIYLNTAPSVISDEI